ncbi:subtilisin-like protein [Russula earlei]|uniref:Subtilisin-like protein n=1 Tax=Russula earlei TaxID=71964 RepID=A0ACC0UFR8_9AGAM|nr:subtilisin-like protein [Russula earlei]
MFLLFLQVFAICSLVAAAPSRRANYVVHERRAAEPVAWMKTRRLGGHNVLPLRVGLAQQNLHELEDLLMSIAHPDSPTYGQHWSPERVAAHFSPSEDTISTVKDWLTTEGFRGDRIRVSPSKGWIDVNATVSEIESLLNTEYHVYTHPSGHEQISCESYSLPDHIREHVELIKPTVHFVHRVPDDPALLRKRSKTHLGAPTQSSGPKTNGATVTEPMTLTNCDRFTTPECLRRLYSINYKPAAPQLNSYGIVEFTPQAYLANDLNLFFRTFFKNQTQTRPKLVSIDGGVVQQKTKSFSYNGESDLDLEYAMGLTDPTPLYLLQTGDLVEGAGFDNWLDAVDGSFCTFDGGDDPTQDGIYPDTRPGGYNKPESCGIIKPPNVVSISYSQDESTATEHYAIRQCNEYGKLGMMGSTVLYSSGDFGVAGNGGVCLNANGQPVPSGGTKFNPSFPATCPFVTAVGATQINPGSTVQDPESACETVIYSGGGFSNIFPMPSYQGSAVSNYLVNHPPPYSAKQYNNSGTVRAYPDLSANGANYVVIIDGKLELVYGTSASAPVVGSIFTLINDARLAHGKGPIGFINPLIYNPLFSSLFHDITKGNNPGCGTPGFSTAKGWDPVTGVGTPNTTLLLTKFLSLP